MTCISLRIGLELEMNDLFSKKDLEESVACYATLAMKVAGEEEHLRKQLKKAEKKHKKLLKAEMRYTDKTIAEWKTSHDSWMTACQQAESRVKEQTSEINDLNWKLKKALMALDEVGIAEADLKTEVDALRKQLAQFWDSIPVELSNKPFDQAIAIISARMLNNNTPDNPAEESYW
jgi:chromosome segregation ATPase